MWAKSAARTCISSPPASAIYAENERRRESRSSWVGRATVARPMISGKQGGTWTSPRVSGAHVTHRLHGVCHETPRPLDLVPGKRGGHTRPRLPGRPPCAAARVRRRDPRGLGGGKGTAAATPSDRSLGRQRQTGAGRNRARNRARRQWFLRGALSVRVCRVFSSRMSVRRSLRSGMRDAFMHLSVPVARARSGGREATSPFELFPRRSRSRSPPGTASSPLPGPDNGPRPGPDPAGTSRRP